MFNRDRLPPNSALLGPVGGILSAGYCVLRRCRLHAPSLHEPQGEVYFTGGYGVMAILCLAAAVLPGVPRFLVNVELVGAGRISPAPDSVLW